MKKEIKVNKNVGYYFPLFNLKGLRGSITPYFGGDLSFGYNNYLLTPTNELSLYEYGSRNVIFTVNNEMFYLNGYHLNNELDELKFTVSPFYQKVNRKNSLFEINATSFVCVNDNVELHKISFKNISNNPFSLDIITAIPLFGRSADNLRDHRQVTSLLNRVRYQNNTIYLKPTLSFDERGHLENKMSYFVKGYIDNLSVNRVITSYKDFIDGSSLNNPKGIFKEGINIKDGKEVIAGIGFNETYLNPNEEITIYLAIGIGSDEYLLNEDIFNHEFNLIKDFFKVYNNSLKFNLISDDITNLTKWITLQPVLRRYYGNSYLPHHDYGRGGRGWRDLWQDLLSLMMFNDKSVKDLLYNNFGGVRIDGSNATIIGDNPGEFKADRNDITRVWSDHGSWPLLTTKTYLNETGDLSFLLLKQSYFDDKFTHYTKQIKTNYSKDNHLRLNNEVYLGTILEHLLVQNIVGYFNQGKNGFLRLEDADWNDGLDMASNLGESISFSHFYANNLLILADFIKNIKDDIYIFESLYLLILEKISLNDYFNNVKNFNEKIISIDKELTIKQLNVLYENFIKKLKEKAWINNTHLESYIKDDGMFLDNKTSINLIGQAMALLNKTLTKDEASLVKDKARELLFNESLGGYKLNTNYHDLLLNLGRAFGFKYGNKENGAVFSHMALMYIYGLYNYEFIKEGHEGYLSLFTQAINSDSNLVVGIPEYFDHDGIGMYPYLTGSASWALILLREQVFGIKMKYGELSLNPKLTLNEFINNKASITTYINNNLIEIIYHNPKKLDYNEYRISKIISNEKEIKVTDIKNYKKIEVYLDEV